MTDLTGALGELRFTIEVKRANTGKVETYELVGLITDGEEPKEEIDGGNSLNGGSERGD